MQTQTLILQRISLLLLFLLISCNNQSNVATDGTEALPSYSSLKLPVQRNGSPDRQLLVFGGNCGNIFEADFIRIGQLFKKQDWAVRALYGDEKDRCSLLADDDICVANSSDIRCCKRGIRKPLLNGTTKVAEAYGTTVQELNYSTRASVLSAFEGFSELPIGSQLLVVIATHGAPATASNSHHEFCLKDGNLSVGDPELHVRLQALKNRSIEIAFIDGSCFGGASVPILSQYGCVVSTQAQNRPAAGGVGDAFNFLQRTAVSKQSQSKIALSDYFETLLLAGESTLEPQISSSLELLNSSSAISAQILSAKPFWRYNNEPNAEYWIRKYEDQYPPTNEPWGALLNLHKEVSRLDHSALSQSYVEAQRYLDRKISYFSREGITFLPTIQTLLDYYDQAITEYKDESISQEQYNTQFLQIIQLERELSSITINLKINFEHFLNPAELSHLKNSGLIESFGRGDLWATPETKPNIRFNLDNSILDIKFPATAFFQYGLHRFSFSSNFGLTGGMRNGVQALSMGITDETKSRVFMEGLYSEILSQVKNEMGNDAFLALKEKGFKLEILNARVEDRSINPGLWTLGITTRVLRFLLYRHTIPNPEDKCSNFKIF